MLSGRNKVRISIWGNVEIGRDPLANTPVYAPGEIKQTWANFSWRRGRESMTGAGSIIDNAYAYFSIRYLSAPFVNTANWLVVKGSNGEDQIYNIVSAQPDLQDRDKIVIEARVRDINSEETDSP